MPAADVWGVKRAHLLLSLLVAIIVLVGGVIGGIHGLGDGRWAAKDALAQVVESARADRDAAAKDAAQAREALRDQIQENRTATLLIKQALDAQTLEMRRVLERLDAQPTPRRRRGTP